MQKSTSLSYAYGSGAELETELELAVRLKYLPSESYNKLSVKLNEVMKMLNTLIRKLS